MKFVWGVSGLMLIVILGLTAGCGADSSGPDADAVPGILEIGGDDGEVVKIGGNYVLRSDQEVERIVVISGLARIEGTVRDEMVVIAGGATLAGSARVQGDAVVLGGTVEIEEGAAVQGDLVVLGGGLEVPHGFEPGGEQVSIGAIPAGGIVGDVIPWFTHGLLLGRPIVPSLPWIWAIVAVLAVLYLLINYVFPGTVHACAQALDEKPLSVGLVGMLAVVLIAPVSLMLVVTVVGLVLIPFFWVLLLVAALVGSVGVARWIGRRILGRGISGEPCRRGEVAAHRICGDHSGLHDSGPRVRRMVRVVRAGFGRRHNRSLCGVEEREASRCVPGRNVPAAGIGRRGTG